MADADLLRAAGELAARAHAGQERADGTPLVEHPREVAALLAEQGADEELQAAALLHDTIEEGGTTEEELAAEFGPRVASLVAAVSEDESIEPYERRKAALRDSTAAAGADALALTAADKISKVAELRRAVAEGRDPGGTPVERRVPHYRASLDLVRDRLGETPL